MARRLRSVAVAAMLRRADPPGVPPAAAADRLAKTHGVCPYCERHHRPGRVSYCAEFERMGVSEFLTAARLAGAKVLS